MLFSMGLVIIFHIDDSASLHHQKTQMYASEALMRNLRFESERYRASYELPEYKALSRSSLEKCVFDESCIPP